MASHFRRMDFSGSLSYFGIRWSLRGREHGPSQLASVPSGNPIIAEVVQKPGNSLPIPNSGFRHCSLFHEFRYNARMQLLTVNITGDGATHTLASAIGINGCKWFQILNSGGGTLNVGGPETDATHGYPVGATSANFQPPIAMAMDFYDLTAIKYWLTNAETAVLLCAF